MASFGARSVPDPAVLALDPVGLMSMDTQPWVIVGPIGSHKTRPPGAPTSPFDEARQFTIENIQFITMLPAIAATLLTLIMAGIGRVGPFKSLVGLSNAYVDAKGRPMRKPDDGTPVENKTNINMVGIT